ncbi:hypothetical protein K439DRAFT_949226 [Ramaria rubella]|nr:hypothetical protein K439DRAFT_949226 [Ramaria rubella]
MECLTALQYHVGPIGITSLHTSYLAVLLVPANFAITLHDYFLTLGTEIELVWSYEWCFANALYFATTYINFVNLIALIPGFLTQCPTSMTTLRTLTVLESLLRVIAIVIAELVLLLRTWALWDKKKIVAIFLFSFPAIPSATFIISGIQQQSMHGFHSISGSMVFLSFLFLAFYESVMLGLYIFKAKKHLKIAHDCHSHLTVVLFRDGIFYYMFLISISVTSMALWAVGEIPASGNLSSLLATLHSVLTKRIFLNLRDVASQESSDVWVDNTPRAVSRLHFVSMKDGMGARSPVNDWG